MLVGRGPSAARGDDWRAYVIDRAVFAFGAAVEHDMDEAEERMTRGKSKTNKKMVTLARQRVLDAYLNITAREETTQGRFRDPALSTRKR